MKQDINIPDSMILGPFLALKFCWELCYIIPGSADSLNINASAERDVSENCIISIDTVYIYIRNQKHHINYTILEI